MNSENKTIIEHICGNDQNKIRISIGQNCVYICGDAQEEGDISGTSQKNTIIYGNAQKNATIYGSAQKGAIICGNAQKGATIYVSKETIILFAKTKRQLRNYKILRDEGFINKNTRLVLAGAMKKAVFKYDRSCSDSQKEYLESYTGEIEKKVELNEGVLEKILNTKRAA